MEEPRMRAEYDFSQAKPNPYLKRLQKSATAKTEPVEYGMQTEDTGIMYLSDCMADDKK
jgi:hypothetical protein